LIQDELFYDNDNTIIDECITFFAAGSQTVKVANTNIICYLIMNPEVGGKLFDELKEKLFNPYKLLNKGAPYDISKIMTNNSFEDLHYY
jgi:cytochrome P450